VGIVKPRIPLDLVLNKESQRKTEALVTIHKGIRYYGNDGVAMVRSNCLRGDPRACGIPATRTPRSRTCWANSTRIRWPWITAQPTTTP
jgi:hypothetical protein